MALLALCATLLLLTGSHALSQPRFTRVPVEQIGVSGGVVSFVCQATGDPKPRVSWKKNGKVVSSRETVIEFDGGAGSVLRIEPLRSGHDQNTYECVAENTEGEVTDAAKLSIVKEDLLPAGFPSIEMSPQLKVVERTRTATMLCAASGDPNPNITWFKDFLPIDIEASNGRLTQLPSGTLQIENSEESDQGKYECVASNAKGVRYSYPANLYVRVRRMPPRFSIPPTSQEVLAGGSVNLTCVAVGSPMPYVKWMKGEVELTKEEEMPIGRNVLQLTDIRQSANYTCVAMSSLGIVEATVQVTVRGQTGGDDVDECQLMPNACQNGGTCHNTFGGFQCVCVNGWTGDYCSVNIDDCASAACHPGSICHDHVASYYCECPHGRTGLLCHLDDACISNPCPKGSNCDTNPINGIHYCTCPLGYFGVSCDQDVDECSLGSNPCEHAGKCLNTKGSFECRCQRGYVGARCELDTNECISNPCQNEATCLDQIGDFHCICMPGYEGRFCEIDTDECESEPCRDNGSASALQVL